jgi:N-acetylglucosamine-6-phosphate deacetylase
VAGLICDGLHVDPIAVRMAWHALGPHRTVLVTDAVAALGVTTTATRLGSLDVTVGPDGVRTADGVLAGSNLRLDEAVRNLIAFTGCTTAEAVCAASTAPATAIGRTDVGRIEPGARADLVILDDELHVERTIIGGHTAWKS